MVTATVYISNDSLALTLDGSKRFPSAKRLVDFAKRHCNLQPARAKGILSQGAEAVIKTMPDLSRHGKDCPGFRPVCERMLLQWQQGIDLACRLDPPSITLPGEMA